MITGNVYKEAIQNNACGFAYYAAVFDEKGKMIDYLFLDVNRAFEELTGLKKENIIGKRYLADVVRDKDQAKKWLKVYAKVVTEHCSVEFDEYSEEYSRYFSLFAYSSENSRFVTLFLDKTLEKKMQEIAKYLINNAGSQIDYDKVTEFACDLSGAQCVAFNLYDESGKRFTAVSLYGASDGFKEKLKALNIEVIGKPRSYDPKKGKNKDIICFDNLRDFAGNAIPEEAVTQIEESFDIGNIIAAKITENDKILGDFILFFKKGEKLQNRGFFELFLSQLGLFIEKSRLEQSLKTSQNGFFTLAEFSPVGFLSCNVRGELIYANKKALEIMNAPSLEKTKSMNLMELANQKKYGFLEKLTECMEKDSEITCEMGYKNVWGKDSWLRVHYNPYKEDGHVVGANVMVDDITDKKRREDALKEQTLRDPLTKAYNRYALDTILLERLNESKEKGFIDGFALLDIDNFKNINDNYGHEIGDRVLGYLAARVMKELRDRDMVVRTGGDEFLIYFHNIKQEKNVRYAVNRIFEKISTKYRFIDSMNGNCYSLDVSCSIGVSFYPKDGDNVNELLTKAADALYEVKNKGKANYLIGP